MKLAANLVSIYVGSAIFFIWGVPHIIATRDVVAGFGPISTENERIITMTCISDGLLLCFIGSLVLLTTIWGGHNNPVTVNIFRLSALTLVLLAVLTWLTGARTKIVPMKICPFVKLLAAILFFIGGGL